MYGMPPHMGGYRGGRGYDDRGYDRGYDDRGYGRRDRYDSGYGGRDRGYDRDRGDRRDRYSGRDRDRNDGANPGRDPLVDEFRNTFGKSRQWSLRDLLGHVVAFCQDQHGSRFIQQRLEVCNEDEKQLVFEEILLVANPLMTDVFGNYVLQKLFEYGTPDQCEQLGLLHGAVSPRKCGEPGGGTQSSPVPRTRAAARGPQRSSSRLCRLWRFRQAWLIPKRGFVDRRCA